MNKVSSFKELEVYQRAFALQQDIFVLTNTWPRNESYSLTGPSRLPAIRYTSLPSRLPTATTVTTACAIPSRRTS